VHNLADELALACLYLAFFLPGHLGRQSQRTANVLNSVGLIGLGCALAWQAIQRVRHPLPVLGLAPMVAGLAAAVANWGVARLLRAPARQNAAVRLAYLHNWGDVGVSLTPAAAGVLVMMTHRPMFDSLVALAVALWLILSTIRELRVSSGDVLWPEELRCGHS
jgi:Co/Zn/Cd efflux system component